MLPARRQVRGLTATSALVAALALATFACSDGRTGPAEPDGAAFAATPDLDRAGRRIVVARNAVAAYREAGEITQQSIADQLRRRLNEAHEGVARNRVPDAIQALNRSSRSRWKGNPWMRGAGFFAGAPAAGTVLAASRGIGVLP